MAKPLNAYREEQYMSVAEFVDWLGISLGTFYRIAHGERPRPTTMRRIARKLKVHPGDITEFIVPEHTDRPE